MDDLHDEIARLRAIAVSPDIPIDLRVIALSERMDLITDQLNAYLDVRGAPGA